jgi:chromosome partitioning protein
MTKIIVFGNEKGGSGKSTTAIHVMAYLLQKNKYVGIIDLDIRQKSILRFLENREAYSKEMGVSLLFPEKSFAKESSNDSKRLAYEEEEEILTSQVETLTPKCDYILIDCPGSHTNFSIFAHKIADLIITPINDSLIDFDLLGRLETRSKKIKNASIYSEMVWNARKHRVGLNLPSTKFYATE